MLWYNAGTVAVTLNSKTVTGTGTQWLANVRNGDAFRGPDGQIYQVENVANNTSITINPAYASATATARPYAILPVQGYPRDLADQAAELIRLSQTEWQSVLKQSDLQDPAGAPVPGKILRTDTFGLGNRLRAWVAGVTGSDPLWVKIATVTGAANQRAAFQFSGAAFGYGSANGATTGIGILSATMGNAATENNLNLEFLYATPENQCAISGLKTVRINSLKFEIWVRARTFSKLMITYSGDMQLVEPHTSGNTQVAAPDPAFHWEGYMYPIWTGRTLNSANIGANMGLKSGAFADLIGDVVVGAAMQSGSNANGRWWRFQNGLQICTIHNLLRPYIDQGGPYVWTTRDRYWPFPATFVGEAPTVSGFSGDGAGSAWVGMGGDVTGLSGATLRVMAGYSTNNEGRFSAMAIGRYK